ncbi:hypothetical protein [Streptomyces sp. MI02-7b]|uniref:hypothetical protein n=1 Tax=Streptomyces sp. MI02-7b TaxID=462941 RepID=UPI0029A9B3B4|nr:hypothetical protein [Streptomyces sp. MI02-7b]MDX3071522.1 hypothetical protein [Streptomyces sp. MI02-7b]
MTGGRCDGEELHVQDNGGGGAVFSAAAGRATVDEVSGGLVRAWSWARAAWMCDQDTCSKAAAASCVSGVGCGGTGEGVKDFAGFGQSERR